jgi:hypothetical protein
MAAKDQPRRSHDAPESIERPVVDQKKGANREHRSRDRDEEHGEGNYKAAREFDAAERAFVNSGKLDEAKQKIRPKTEAEEREMIEAEDKARRRAKEEDPALLKKPPR